MTPSAFGGLKVIRGHLDSEPEVRLSWADEPCSEVLLITVHLRQEAPDPVHEPVGSDHSEDRKPLSQLSLLGGSRTLLASSRARQSAGRSPGPAQTISHRGRSSPALCGHCSGIQWQTNWKHEMQTELEQLQAKRPPPGLQPCSSSRDCRGLCLYLSNQGRRPGLQSLQLLVCGCN